MIIAFPQNLHGAEAAVVLCGYHDFSGWSHAAFNGAVLWRLDNMDRSRTSFRVLVLVAWNLIWTFNAHYRFPPCSRDEHL